jgi:hypothetical protein
MQTAVFVGAQCLCYYTMRCNVRKKGGADMIDELDFQRSAPAVVTSH